MAVLNRVKEWVAVPRNQNVAIAVGLALLLVHLIDEIAVLRAGLLTTDTAASLVMAGLVVFYTRLSPKWRMGLTLCVGILIKLQLIGEHVVPYFKEGHTAGLATAIVALAGTVVITGVGAGLLAEIVQVSRSARAPKPVEAG
jgi:hypothetical protein